jgi:hypothetical protein
MINIQQMKSGNLSWMNAVVGGRRRTERRKARHVRWVACGPIRRGRASLGSVRRAFSLVTFFGQTKKVTHANERESAYEGT